MGVVRTGFVPTLNTFGIMCMQIIVPSQNLFII